MGTSAPLEPTPNEIIRWPHRYNYGSIAAPTISTSPTDHTQIPSSINSIYPPLSDKTSDFVSVNPIPVDPIPVDKTTDPVPTDPIPTDPIPTDPIPIDSIYPPLSVKTSDPIPIKYPSNFDYRAQYDQDLPN